MTLTIAAWKVTMEPYLHMVKQGQVKHSQCQVETLGLKEALSQESSVRSLKKSEGYRTMLSTTSTVLILRFTMNVVLIYLIESMQNCHLKSGIRSACMKITMLTCTFEISQSTSASTNKMLLTCWWWVTSSDKLVLPPWIRLQADLTAYSLLL